MDRIREARISNHGTLIEINRVLFCDIRRIQNSAFLLVSTAETVQHSAGNQKNALYHFRPPKVEIEPSSTQRRVRIECTLTIEWFGATKGRVPRFRKIGFK
jgi:hypothetical protein